MWFQFAVSPIRAPALEQLDTYIKFLSFPFAFQAYFQLEVKIAWGAKILFVEDFNIYEELKFMPKKFTFFPITISPLPLVLNSWSKVQFWDKISTITFSSPVDVLTISWTFCVRNSILTRRKRTQGHVFEIRIWASTLLVLYFVSYLIRSLRFIPSLHLIPGLQSAFYTPSAANLLYLVCSLGAQPAVCVLYRPIGSQCM